LYQRRIKMATSMSPFFVYDSRIDFSYSFLVRVAIQTSTTHALSDEDRWSILQTRLQNLRTIKAVEFFREHGIDPILIKGAAAARYYPDARRRMSVDVDLAVASSDFDSALDIAVRCEGVGVDVHRELRHLDPLPWDDLVGNSVELPLEGSFIRVLRPEDDLRVLCVHWLTDGGAYKERLWDIYFAVANRPPDFDWQRFLDAAGPRRRRWYECTLGIAAKYLELDLRETPVMDAENRVPQWVTKAIETEWEAEIKPRPLEESLFDREMLMAQLRRRMRPNPIFATIDCEGSIDARTRVFYQVRNWFRRIPSSVRRVSRTLQARRRWRAEL
jgi:hypothetical protein